MHRMNLICFWWAVLLWANHGCERRKTKVVSIIRKNKAMNKRAKELMSLSTGDKFPILCSADMCCILRLNWLWFKTLLISNTSPFYIWKIFGKAGVCSWVWSDATEFCLWKDRIMLNPIKKKKIPATMSVIKRFIFLKLKTIKTDLLT